MYSLPKNVYRERIDFSKIKTTVPIPNLIEIQKKSYERFLQMNRLPSEREDAGLQSVFKSVFPISDFRENSSLEFIEYSIGNWECKCGRLAGLHHLRKPCTNCLVVWNKDPETGVKTIRDIKEQEVYYGDIPLMTDNGTFIINGTERVIVSQLHRSPGAFFHSEDKTLYVAQIIPYRGSWVEFEYDQKNLLYVRIDRKRKFLASVFLRALGLRAARDITVGNDVITHAGKKISASALAAMKKANLEEVEVADAELEGAFAASDVVDPSTGEVILEANEELTPRAISLAQEKQVERLEIFFPERDEIGSVLSSTLKKDPIHTHEEALIEIYRRLRPGDPPTLESSRSLFENMFFNPQKY